MAKEAVSSQVWVERFAEMPTVNAKLNRKGEVEFVDEDGNKLTKKTAVTRYRAWKYRKDNPEAAKESSRKYAERIRRLAGVQPKGSVVGGEDDLEDDDMDDEVDIEEMEDAATE